MCDLGTVNLSDLILTFPSLRMLQPQCPVSIPQPQEAQSPHRALALDSSLAGMLCPCLLHAGLITELSA